jgi:RHS repeat-associated protein
MTAWHPQTGAPTAWTQGGAADAWSDRWYHYDMLGNVTGELDASGLVQSHIWMEAFGTVLSGGQTGRHLTTKTYDPDAGLYYFSARWLSPHIGLFLSVDPVVSGLQSPYILAFQGPVHGVDPNGEWTVSSGSGSQQQHARDIMKRLCAKKDQIDWSAQGQFTHLIEIPGQKTVTDYACVRKCFNEICDGTKNMQIQIGGFWCRDSVLGYSWCIFGSSTIHVCKAAFVSDTRLAETLLHETMHRCGHCDEEWPTAVGETNRGLGNP